MRLEAAARKLEAVIAGVRVTARPDRPLPPRQGAIREAVIEVLMQADEALAPLEVRRRAANRVGRSLEQHTVTATLGLLASDPAVAITRTGPAEYARTVGAKDAIPELSPRKEAVKERVLKVLSAAPGPMRPTQIWAGVETQFSESIGYDTVAGFLSFAARHPDVPIVRVRRGWYGLVNG